MNALVMKPENGNRQNDGKKRRPQDGEKNQYQGENI
jgi:hypothetical protein